MKAIERICMATFCIFALYDTYKFVELLLELNGIGMPLRAEWSGWVQGIGSILAVAAAISVLLAQNHFQQKRDHERRISEVKHMLMALRDEARVLVEIMRGNFGDTITNLQRGQVINAVYPVDNDVFQIFDGYKGSIGKIPDDDVRHRIVLAYSHARAFVYTINQHNDLVKDFDHYAIIAHQSKSKVDMEITDAKYAGLANYSWILKESWERTQKSTQIMIETIEAYLKSNYTFNT